MKYEDNFIVSDREVPSADPEIEQGLKQVEMGDIISHAEAKKRIKQCLI